MHAYVLAPALALALGLPGLTSPRTGPSPDPAPLRVAVAPPAVADDADESNGPCTVNGENACANSDDDRKLWLCVGVGALVAVTVALAVGGECRNPGCGPWCPGQPRSSDVLAPDAEADSLALRAHAALEAGLADRFEVVGRALPPAAPGARVTPQDYGRAAGAEVVFVVRRETQPRRGVGTAGTAPSRLLLAALDVETGAPVLLSDGGLPAAALPLPAASDLEAFTRSVVVLQAMH